MTFYKKEDGHISIDRKVTFCYYTLNFTEKFENKKLSIFLYVSVLSRKATSKVLTYSLTPSNVSVKRRITTMNRQYRQKIIFQLFFSYKLNFVENSDKKIKNKNEQVMKV